MKISPVTYTSLLKRYQEIRWRHGVQKQPEFQKRKVVSGEEHLGNLIDVKA